MVMPGGRDPSVQSLVGDLTGFLRRNLPQRPAPMAAQRPMPPATGMDPEGLGRALLGPNADPETLRRMLEAIANANTGVDMAGNLARTDPTMARLGAMRSDDRAAPQGPGPHWTQSVGEKTYPLGRPTNEIAGMTLGAASLPFLPLASPMAGAIGGGLGGLGSSVYGGARTPTEAFLGGAVPGAMMGLAGAGAHRALRGAEPMPRPAAQFDPPPMRQPTQAQAQPRVPRGWDQVNAQRFNGGIGQPQGGWPVVSEGTPSPADLADLLEPPYSGRYGLSSAASNPIDDALARDVMEPPFSGPRGLPRTAPGPMPRNDRGVGGQFIRPWNADEIRGTLESPAGLPQQSLLSRFEGEMARTQPGSPVADAGLRGMDPGDWFSKTQPGVGTAQRLEGAIPQQDAIMEMLRRQAPNPMMQPAGMPDPDGIRAFFQALSGMRGL